MHIETLDHVALWVAQRETLAEILLKTLDVHTIDRTDTFTIVGSDARRGKLTLFDAEGPRDQGALARIGFRVTSLERAASRLPDDLPTERPDERTVVFDAPEGLRLALVEGATDVDYDLDHVALFSRDPSRTGEELATLGFGRSHGRLHAGGAFVDLVEGEPAETEQPLLNHLGLRVTSADDHLEEARTRGLEVADVVDAANTYAVFVWGPERLKLEYVEHKPTFSLV
jgi:hypothetical protein